MFRDHVWPAPDDPPSAFTDALIVLSGQVTTSQIDWHRNFYAAAAENASGATGVDMLTGFFATVLYIESF